MEYPFFAPSIFIQCFHGPRQLLSSSHEILIADIEREFKSRVPRGQVWRPTSQERGSEIKTHDERYGALLGLGEEGDGSGVGVWLAMETECCCCAYEVTELAPYNETFLLLTFHPSKQDRTRRKEKKREDETHKHHH
jgi:hypothetical protein